MTTKMVNVDFCLPESRARTFVTLKFHVDDYAGGRDTIILGRELLTSLGLDIRFSSM